jgi:hypothetical protein
MGNIIQSEVLNRNAFGMRFVFLMRIALLWLCAICGCLFTLTDYVYADRRLALLIGNKSYGQDVGPLANPINDVALIATKLKATGFEVETISDVKRTTLMGAVRAFAARLDAAGNDAIGLFYYAGHGAADPSGVNYIIPIDAARPETTDFWDQSVKLDEILTLMDRAQAAARFIIFDACRNQLRLPQRWLVKGFTPVTFQSGTFVAFSTAPNRAASDGEPQKNGPYAAALVAELNKPGKTHLEIFHDTKMSVVMASGGAQLPWESNGLARLVEFSPAEIPIHFSAAAQPSFSCEDYLRGAPLKSSRGRTPVADLMCNDPGLARADARMADAYDKLKRLLTPEERDRLEKVEHQDWRSLRDKRCDVTWDNLVDKKFIHIRCLNGETLLRAEEYEIKIARIRLMQEEISK